MNWRRISAGVIIGTLILVIGYDLIPAFLTPESGDTISEVIRDWSARGFVLPYLGGVLVGHFWVRIPGAESAPWVWLAPAALAAGLGLAGIVITSAVAWVGLLFAGILAGALFFPLGPPAG